MARNVRRKTVHRGQVLVDPLMTRPVDVTVELLDPSDQTNVVFDEGAARFTVEAEGIKLQFAMGLGDLRYAIRPIETRG